MRNFDLDDMEHDLYFLLAEIMQSVVEGVANRPFVKREKKREKGRKRKRKNKRGRNNSPLHKFLFYFI